MGRNFAFEQPTSRHGNAQRDYNLNVLLAIILYQKKTDKADCYR